MAKATNQPGTNDAPTIYERLTQIAFMMAIALVLARATYSAGSRTTPLALGDHEARAAGPASMLVLDLFCCLPALLVLARRSLDRQYVLRFYWSMIPLLLLCSLGAASVFWSADKFAAILSAAHFIAAAAMLFAASQLVRSWGRLRLVASFGVGLLLAYFAHALLFTTIDGPDLKRYWNSYTCVDHPKVNQQGPGTCPDDGKPLEKNSDVTLRLRGLEPGTFAAKQFAEKVLANELFGPFNSPNTLAAVTVVLALLAIGLAIQRFVDDREDRAWIGLLILVPLAAWIIWRTQSRTAIITPVIGLALFAIAWRFRQRLAAAPARLYWIAVILVAIGAAAVIAHGVFHKSLIATTLTFRWYYWTGAWRIFTAHPILGVGLDNFSLHYLAARLPYASEEVRDPHNLFVRIFVELGIVGLILILGWVLRLSFELTRPNLPAESKSNSGRKAIGTIAIVSFLAIFINIVTSVDFNADGVFVLNEILRRFNMLAMLIIGTTLAAVRSLKDQSLDARPAPLLLWMMLIALAIFLLHNMIDFAIFEPGAMMVFALLAGSALGARQPSVAGQKRRTVAASLSLAGAVILFIAAAVFVVIPTAVAEENSHLATIALRTDRPFEAARLFGRARESQPANAEYAFRAAQSLMGNPSVGHPNALNHLKQAIDANPMDAQYYSARARYLAGGPSKEQSFEQIAADYEKSLALDPYNLSLRIEYADLLGAIPSQRAKAVEQYGQALKFNDMLKPDEPKRIRDTKLEELKLKASSTQ